MSIQDNQRPLEEGIHTDLAGRMSYAGYLRLDLRRDRVEVDLMGLDDVRRADSAVARQSGWVVERGRPGAQKTG